MATLFPVDSLYETLRGVILGVINGEVVKVNSDGTFTEFTGDTVTRGSYCYWAEDGQNVYLAHGGKLARVDVANLTVTLLNQNTPSAVTHVVRTKGYLLCNGNDQIIGSTSFELSQVFQTSSLNSAVTLTEHSGWILVAGGIGGIPGQGCIFLSKDNGLSWERTYEISGLAGNEEVLSLCYMGGGVVLAGTSGFDDSITINHGTILRSTDYGQTWIDLGTLGTNVTLPILAKIDSNIAIAGGTSLFRSTDNGLTWAAIPTASFSSEVGTCLVWSASLVFVGVVTTSVAHIWMSVDAGVTFTDSSTLDAVTPAAVVASIRVTSTIGLLSVQVSPVSKLYRTVDSGTTWTDLGVIGLEAGMTPTVFLLTSTGDLLFAASGNVQPSQLWKSTDNGIMWKQVGELDVGEADGSTVNDLIEPHTVGDALAVGSLSFTVSPGSDTAAKWQTGIGKNVPQGDVFFSEDISNNYEAVDSWERFNAQSVPDSCTGVFQNRGLVFAGGPDSVEINFNSSDPAFPWQVSDPSLPYGLGAPNCVAAGTPILMANGSYRKVELIKPGQFVQTLEGSKKVLAAMEPRLVDCVEAVTQCGKQIHPTTHPVLMADGKWGSYASLTNQISDRASSGQHQEISQPRQLSFPVVLYGHRPQSNVLPRQKPKKTSSESKSQIQFDETSLIGAHTLSPNRSYQQHNLSQQKPIQDCKFSHVASNEKQYGRLDLERVSDFQFGYQMDYRSYDERLLHQIKISQDVLPLLADAGEQILLDYTQDVSDNAQEYSHHVLSEYEHPYTGQVREVTVPSFYGTCVLTPVGKRVVYDLTVEDANHYITSSKLVNKNSWINWDDLNLSMYLSCTDKLWEVVKFQSRQQQEISRVYAAIINDRTMVSSPETAKAWGVSLRGLPFYVLSFQEDDLTIVYNVKKDHWFRWGVWNGTAYEAAIINAYTYSRTLKKHLIGDRRATGKVFEIGGTSEDGEDIRFELTSGHVEAGGWSPKPAGRMLFKCKRGDVTDATEPTFTYEARDNGNPTFQTAREVSLGLAGNSEFWGVLNRMGTYQTRQHRIVYLGSNTDFIFAGADES